MRVMKAEFPAASAANPGLAELLLFLLPVAGAVVRHWTSGLFAAMVAVSLLAFTKRATDAVTAEERRLLGLFVLFFVSFIVATLWRDWSDAQSRYFEAQARFLLIVPLYLWLRQREEAGVWLLRGTLLGTVFLVYQGFYDVYVLDAVQAWGVYSPNFLGPCATLAAFFALAYAHYFAPRGLWRHTAVASIVLAAAALSFSASRGAFLGAIVLTVLWIAMHYRGRRMIYATLVGVITLTAVYQLGPLSSRVSDGIVEYQYAPERRQQTTEVLSNIGRRLELLRASYFIFREDPLLGVGGGNFEQATKIHIAQGRLHPDTVSWHPHNAYLEMLVSKGLVGFAVFIAMLAYPLRVFIRGFNQSRGTSVLGILLIAGFGTFSLVDASPFIMNNYVSIFLVYLSVFFSWHVRTLRSMNR